MLDLLNERVPLVDSFLKAISSGDGRKSASTFTGPMGSSVYFIFLRMSGNHTLALLISAIFLYGSFAKWLEIFCGALLAYLHLPLIRHRVAEAGQGMLTNMFEHVAA